MEKRIHRLGNIRDLTDLVDVEIRTKDMTLFTCPNCQHREVFALDPESASC